MKNMAGIHTVCLMLFVALVVGCQPSSVDSLEPRIPTNAYVAPRYLPPDYTQDLDAVIVTTVVETITPESTEIIATDLPIAATPPTITVTNQISPTKELEQTHQFIPIDSEVALSRYIQWTDQGKSLIFSLTDLQLPAHSTKYRTYRLWWEYDVETGSRQQLPPPQTRVSDAVRASLGLCPFDMSEATRYPCSSILHETADSEYFVFSSDHPSSATKTGIANVDGSNVVYVEGIPGSPGDVAWSSDNQWLLIGHYWGTDNSNRYYLVSTDGSFVQNLEELTGVSHFRLQGVKPQFSPDGLKLAFAGIEADCNRRPCPQLDQEDEYGIYVLELDTMDLYRVSDRFGSFMWLDDGSGLYILEGLANSVAHAVEYVLEGSQYVDLYHVDLSEQKPTENLLAIDIPTSIPYIGTWAYSPDSHALAGTFGNDGTTFGILLLDR